MRRGHGSTKVPGVKLRPAAPAQRSKIPTKPTKEEPSEDVDSTELLASCEKPLKKLTLCASGVMDKVTLFQYAIQLGAKTSSDLTDKVAYLICEKPGTQKYNYCITHGIPVMKPSWIYEMHAKWINGETIDMVSIISEHRFPAFHSVRLCLTAIDDVERRTKIQKLVESNGGTYVETIGKGVQLTHLVCGPDRGYKSDERGFTAKMKFVEKLNKVAEKEVQLVWEEWFWDCLGFHGLLPEADYSVSQPRPQLRKIRGASPLLEPITSTADPLRKSGNNPSSDKAATEPTDSEEFLAIRHAPEATVQLWGGLLAKRGFSVQAGKLVRDPSKVTTTLPKSDLDTRAAPTAGKCDTKAQGKNSSSLNRVFTRTKSIAIKSEPSDSSNTALQHLRSGFSSSSARDASGGAGPSVKVEPQLPDGERNLFAGLKLKVLGDANSPKFLEAIELRGGVISSEENSFVDFVIVRLASGRDIFHATKSEDDRQKFRTECWVEQCIFEERVCHVDEHLAFAPLKLAGDVAGSENLKLHISGLQPHEKTPTARLIKAIGAGLTDQLSRKNTHLLCPGAAGPKFVKAKEWGIPVVSLQWLYDTVTAGEVQNPSSYLVDPSSDEGTTADNGITDITNCEFVQGSSRDRKTKSITAQSDSSENTCPESAATSTWTTNGLLSDSVEQSSVAGLSPQKISALSLSSRPTSPVKQGDPKQQVCDSPTKTNRVPSSTTPSPLKIPPTRQDTLISTPSTLSGGTQVNSLKDALTSLLGKRQSSDDSEGVQLAKQSKRSKAPPRPKSKREPFSRASSTDNISRQTSLNSYPLPALDSKLPSLQAEEEDDGMKVTYEYPSQQQEKQKLLSMLSGEPAESAESAETAEPEPAEKVQEQPRKGRNLVRRATRK